MDAQKQNTWSIRHAYIVYILFICACTESRYILQIGDNQSSLSKLVRTILIHTEVFSLTTMTCFLTLVSAIANSATCALYCMNF